MFLKRAQQRCRGVLKRTSEGSNDRLVASVLRRRRLHAKFTGTLPGLWKLLLAAGFGYLFLLPLKQLGRGHHVSENALQPAQVNTYWNWADVHIADLYAAKVEKWMQLEPSDRAMAMQGAFDSLGLPSASQSYSFGLGHPSASLNGTNVYGILQAPKTDGTEALVLSASWLSRALNDNGDQRINVRGVAIVLALANYFKKYAMWSKDIIFLIGDGYVDGTQAWLDAYYGFHQPNLKTQSLPITSSPIWAALNLDYPHHSFKYLGLYYEGANGHLTNLDFVNTASHIVRHVGMEPVLHSSPPGPTSTWLETYLESAKAITHQVVLGALGKAPGPEAAYGRYMIDVLTLHGVPAEGPHGFHSLGVAVESIFRSLNNLLERFHASLFLYIMTSVYSFISVANYLAATILISAGLTIRGLLLWANAATTQSSSSSSSLAVDPAVKPQLRTGGKEPALERRIGKVLGVMLATHAIGLALFFSLTQINPLEPPPIYLLSSFAFVIFFSPTLLALVVLPPEPSLSLPEASPHVILKAFSLFLAGLSIAVVATLNFGASVVLSLVLPLPLLATSPRIGDFAARFQQVLLAAFSPPVLWILFRWLVNEELADQGLKVMLVDWHVVGTATLPFVFCVVVPLLLQSATSALL